MQYTVIIEEGKESGTSRTSRHFADAFHREPRKRKSC